MKRAKLRRLQRNAAVVLGHSGTADDPDVIDPASGQNAIRGFGQDG